MVRLSGIPTFMKSVNRERASRGYTIIELFITMAVLGVVIGLAVPAFGEWLQNQQIRGAADAIQNGFQVARAEAIRRNLQVKVVLAPPATGWVVSESESGASIQSRSHEEGTRNARAGTCAAASGTMRCLRVLVTGGGSIRMCDPKAAAPDPRACP